MYFQAIKKTSAAKKYRQKTWKLEKQALTVDDMGKRAIQF